MKANDRIVDAETTDPAWKTLYKIGGWAAALMALIYPLQIVVFTIAPPADTAIGWFTLFQSNKLLGLLSFELLFVFYGVLSIPVTIALYVALRRTDPSLTGIYLALGLIGTAMLFAARPAFEMLSLSNQYAAATTEAQRSLYLAAGETLMAIFKGTAFQVSYYLGSITGLIVSIVMLKSNIFSKGTAYVRIASSVLDFGILIPKMGIFISIFSVLFLLVWNILISRRFFQLGRAS
ncbi:MAG: hypothetical protein ACOYZ8_15425 [Chloroflexota bacterium]